jgi:formamidopyrimidine-DNA glycosylase
MPELPEVETVRRGLEPAMTGRRFRKVELRRPDLRFPLPERFAVRLERRTVERLERRAKYILVHLDNAEVLTMHLGMTGRFTIARPDKNGRQQLGEFTYEAGADHAHDHVVFTMSDGTTITYNDARRFGYMTLLPEAELAEHPHFKGLGVEPLGNALNADYLARRAFGRKTDLKAFLMDQRIVAGLGNIYVCEALWRAHLSPERSAHSLATRGGKPTLAAERLVIAIRSVLDDAIDAGGSTLRDYKQADGSLGYFQHRFAAYGREGEPCLTPGCRGKVRRKTQGGRSTFACRTCQR